MDEYLPYVSKKIIGKIDILPCACYYVFLTLYYCIIYEDKMYIAFKNCVVKFMLYNHDIAFNYITNKLNAWILCISILLNIASRMVANFICELLTIFSKYALEQEYNRQLGLFLSMREDKRNKLLRRERLKKSSVFSVLDKRVRIFAFALTISFLHIITSQSAIYTSASFVILLFALILTVLSIVHHVIPYAVSLHQEQEKTIYFILKDYFG